MMEFLKKIANIPEAWLALAFAIWFALAFSMISRNSLSIDEPAHIGAGLSYIEYFDFRMNPEHPPIGKIAAALPAYLFARPAMETDLGNGFVAPWYDGNQHAWGYYLIFLSSDNPQRVIFFARIVPVLIGAIGGLLAFFWAREISRSAWGGLAAAVLLLFNPEYLGHSGYVTFDVPVVVGFGLCSWMGWRFWKSPTLLNGALFGIAAAIGSQWKLPIAVFAVIQLLTMSSLIIFAAHRKTNRAKLLIFTWIITAVLGFLAAWVGSGFRFSFLPESAELYYNNPFIPPYVNPESAIESLVNTLHGLRVLPEISLAALGHTASFSARIYFLLGEYRLTGWYHYFFVTYLLKTPLLFLFASLAIPVSLLFKEFRHRGKSASQPHRWERAFLLWLPFLVMLLMMIFSKANLGHRYILFIYFPLSVMMGAFCHHVWRKEIPWKICVILLLASQVFIAILSHPHGASYFNRLAGADKFHASQKLQDSNIDWGQDFQLLGRYMKENEIGPINLAVFGYNRPETFGITEYRWILADYPYSLYQIAVTPDPSLPSVVSFNNVEAVKKFTPGTIEGPPDVILNSIGIWFPREGD